MAKIEYRFGIKDPKTGELSQFTAGQQEFIDNQWDKPNACAWGGVGGGKTDAIVWPLAHTIIRGIGATALCAHIDQKLAYNVLIQKLYSQLDLARLRPQYKKVYGYDPLVKENHQTCEAVIDLRIRWDDEKQTIVYDESVPPSRIEWTGVDKKTGRIEKLAWGGLGWDLILVTQLELMEEAAYEAMGLRVGRRVLPGLKPRLLSDANAKRGHWSKKLFADRKFRDGQRAEDYYCRKFTMYDNVEHLDPSYIARQEARSPKMRAMVLFGEVDNEGGYVYEAFGRDTHLVQFSKIPFKASWQMCEFYDWGKWPDPFFALWGMKDHEGNLWILGEHEHYNTDPYPTAKIVMELRKQLQLRIEEQMGFDAGTMIKQPVLSYGPPDMNISQAGSGVNGGPSLTVGDQFLRNPMNPDWRDGIVVQTISPRARTSLGVESSKISALSQMFTIDPAHSNPITGATGAPHIYICDECERVIDQIESAEYFGDDGRANFMNDKRIRNEFAVGPDGDKIEATHHWDGEATLRLAAQEFYKVNEPEVVHQETIFTENWRKRNHVKRKYTTYTNGEPN